MKKIYQVDIKQLASNYEQENFRAGLTSAQAHSKLAADGPNVLVSKQTPKWKIFLRQFNNIVIYILLLSALLR